METFVQKKKVDKELIDKLCNACGCGRDLAEVLAIRGFENEKDAQEFLNPNLESLTPVFNYTGMAEAVERIKRAAEFKETVVIYGDYDCDGVCATTIMYLFLKSIGIDVKFYIPDRKREGYGLHREALEEIAEGYYPDLIITVDCGITSREDIDFAMNDLGIDFIVTDHHEPPKDLPDCIVVNPKVDRLDNTFNELCGAGIALRLCEAIGGQEILQRYMDICAIATIADVVPLLSDNRIIVKYGLGIINSRARTATKLLLEVAGVKGDETVTSTDIAFKIVPRINAVGRIADSTKAVNMLVESDFFYINSMVEMANEFNKERQQFTDDLVEDCLSMLESYDLVNNRIIVIYSDKWEAGVLGIASAKITSMFNRPTILFTSDGEYYKGSARSITGVNIYECVNACKTFLYNFGGHTMACGVTCEKHNIESFIFAINEYARTLDKNLFIPKAEFELQRGLDELSYQGIAELSRLEPCGMENPRVKYNICINTPIFNRISTTKHIKSKGKNDVELVYFDGLQQIRNINNSKSVNMLCDFGLKSYANRLYAQGIVHGTEFDWNKFEFDDDYLAIRYAYLAKYGDTSLFSVEYIKEKQIDKFLDNGLYGVCFLAYNASTFEKYSTLLGDRLIKVDYNTLSDVNPLNRLVLDLDINQNLAYYNNVVFLDALPCLGVLDYYKFNKDVNIYMLQDSICTDYLSRVKESFPNIDDMRVIFVELKNLLAGNTKISNFGDLYAEYCSKCKGNKIAFYIAMFVFYELKIIKLNGGFYVDNSVKTSLDSSTIYQRIKELIYAGKVAD